MGQVKPVLEVPQIGAHLKCQVLLLSLSMVCYAGAVYLRRWLLLALHLTILHYQWMFLIWIVAMCVDQAYMLNPAIYSAHLKLHPLMVLSALVVAEHSMGVWGLLLAVPMTVFALDYLIKYPDSSVTEVGAKELEKVMGQDDEPRALAAVAVQAPQPT
jgi:predicted PurR-regulated permease PerM